MTRVILIISCLSIGAINLSFATNYEKVGVLILAHGGSDSSWDEAVKDAI